MSSPKIGIVILNYVTYEDTIRCLEMLKGLEYDNFFVVVVDNLSPNNSYNEILNYISMNALGYPGYIIVTERNGGYSYGNNIGIKKAENLGAEYILIMNNDIIINDNRLLCKMVDFMNNNPNAAMIGPGIIQKNNIIELPMFSRIKPFNYIVNNICYPIYILYYRLQRRRMQNIQRPIRVYSVSGCCFMIRANVLKEIGYLDENVFLYGEEYILGEKLHKKGYEAYFIPTIRLTHQHSKTIGSYYTAMEILKKQHESHKYYLNCYRKDINSIIRTIMIGSECFKLKLYIPIIIFIKRNLIALYKITLLIR